MLLPFYNNNVILYSKDKNMKILFDSDIPDAEKEFNTVLSARHFVKLDYIKTVVDAVGFKANPDNLIKHLWGDVYEMRPHDGRVIFVLWDNDNAIVLGAYLKRSQKMPQKIIRKMENRENVVLANLKGNKHGL